MKNKILIPIIILIILLVLGGGFFIWHQFIKPAEENLIFEPDETILAEFCREVITRAQLREITGYEGVFNFEVEEGSDDLTNGIMKMCKIRTAEGLGERLPSLSILLLPDPELAGITIEEQYSRIKKLTIILGMDPIAEIREVEEIGKKAFLSIIEGLSSAMFFIDADINQIIRVEVAPEFDYEVAMDLARQAEANLR